MKIYLASAVTQASEEFKTFIEEFRLALKKDFEVLDYFGLRPGEAREVFEYNKQCIEQCDLVVAECSEQSLGTGFEIAFALSLGKRVLAFADEKSKVGRMIVGITDKNYSFQKYSSASEIIEVLKNL